MFELTQEAVEQLQLEEKVEYSTDVSKIIEMGVMSSPVLAIDGQPVMVCSGDAEQIKKALSGAASKEEAHTGCHCGKNSSCGNACCKNEGDNCCGGHC
jgi:hypothetical protein